MQLDCRSELRDLGKNGTTVRGYTTGINSHDGTTRLKWGNVSFTVCCKNTFLHAESLLANSYKHTAGIQEEVDMSVRNVLALGLKEAELFRLFRRMSEVPLSGNMIRNVVREVSGIDMDSKTIGEDHSTKLIKKSERLLSSITTETAQKGNTLWGLFSGITHFTSHVMSNRRGENARLTNKYLGSGLKVDNNTISYLSSFIK
jgi:hypothetical protein